MFQASSNRVSGSEGCVKNVQKMLAQVYFGWCSSFYILDMFLVFEAKCGK